MSEQMTAGEIRQELERLFGGDLPFKPGLLITADELNAVLTALLDRILHHRHQGNAGQSADGSPLGAAALEPGSVGGEELANAAVTGDKIAPGAVASAQLAAGAVGEGQLAEGAVGSDRLADDVVTSAKLAPGLRSRLEQLISGPTTYGYFLWVDPQTSVAEEWWQFDSQSVSAFDIQRFEGSGELKPVRPFFSEQTGLQDPGGGGIFLVDPSSRVARTAFGPVAGPLPEPPSARSAEASELVLPSGNVIGGGGPVGQQAVDRSFVIDSLELQFLIGGGDFTPQLLERKLRVMSLDPGNFGVSSWKSGTAPFHPGIGGRSVFFLEGEEPPLFEDADPSSEQLSALKSLLYHFDADVALNNIEQLRQLLGNGAFLNFVNNPQNLPGGYMSSGDVNIQSIQRLPKSGDMPARLRLRFELPYVSSDYTVNATAELGEVTVASGESLRPLLFPVVVQRAKTHCDFTFVDAKTGEAIDKAIFSVAIHGALAPPSSGISTSPAAPPPPPPTTTL